MSADKSSHSGCAWTTKLGERTTTSHISTCLPIPRASTSTLPFIQPSSMTDASCKSCDHSSKLYVRSLELESRRRATAQCSFRMLTCRRPTGSLHSFTEQFTEDSLLEIADVDDIRHVPPQLEQFIPTKKPPLSDNKTYRRHCLCSEHDS